jgi:hypothetical protein
VGTTRAELKLKALKSSHAVTPIKSFPAKIVIVVLKNAPLPCLAQKKMLFPLNLKYPVISLIASLATPPDLKVELFL